MWDKCISHRHEKNETLVSQSIINLNEFTQLLSQKKKKKYHSYTQNHSSSIIHIHKKKKKKRKKRGTFVASTKELNFLE